jgi:hypothetical protein
MRIFSLVGLGTMGTLSLTLALSSATGCGGSSTDIPGADSGSGTDATSDTKAPTDTGKPDTIGSKDGGSDTSEPEGGSDTSVPEGGGGGDGSGPANCGGSACTGTEVCCADISGPDAGIKCEATCTNKLDCLANSDCSGGTPICCATAVIDDPTGTLPSCIQTGAKSVTTVCSASGSCASDIKLSCNATDTLRGCAAPSDCTDPTYKDCCQITVAGETLSGCVSDLIKNFGKLTCM